MLGLETISANPLQIVSPDGYKGARQVWWPRPESNQRHTDFQSAALPTELLGRAWVLPLGLTAGRRGLYLRRLFQTVAEAADGDDVHAARLELLAQPVNVHLDRVRRDLLAPLAQ